MAHQEEEPKNRLIVGIGLGALATIIAAMYTLGSYYDVLRDKEQQSKNLGRENPDLVELHKLEEKRLGENAYAVLDPNDPKKRRVRIPIERAMTLLAQRGRDNVPSIQPDPATQAIVAPGAAPAASASASAPAASSVAPPFSPPAPSPSPPTKH